VQPPNGNLGSSAAAADIQNPIAWTRTQRLLEELGEVIVPPLLA
jgi:hypothetical protein